MSISPGPVNLITLSTGVNHGFRLAIPFVSGASIGFALLLFAVGAGFNQLALQYQPLMNLLGFIGSAFICYLGFKIASSKPEISIEKAIRPTFYQGVILQWLNPKAWIACMAGVSAFNLAGSTEQLMQFVTIYFVICYASIAGWALLGTKLTGLLQSPASLRVFNALMGSSLMLIAVYLVVMQINA
jgi:threonine/homoserine/homoserine lactone efflux protein